MTYSGAPSESQPPAYHVEAPTAESWNYLHGVYARAQEMGLTTLRQLDDYFCAQRAQWHAIPEAQRGNPGPVIELVGISAGFLLAQEAQLNWVWYSDAQGAEWAIYTSQHPVGLTDIVLFPVDAVSKRWFDLTSSGPLAWANTTIGVLYQQIFDNPEAQANNERQVAEATARLGADVVCLQEHFLAFPLLDSAQQAASYFTRHGWVAANPEPYAADPSLALVKISRQDKTISLPEAERNRCLFSKAACDYGGTYLGWNASPIV